MLPVYTASRYVVPLKEGGSLPAILDTDEGGTFVTKFRGAGQGARALVAEIIVGGLGRALELPVPDLAIIELDESFGRSERDPEIQDILKASRGINVGLRYLPGAFNYDPVAMPDVDPELAASIIWLDAFVTNIDRTPRNPNLMMWEDRVWMIDHGAALYFHHNWDSLDETRIRTPFAAIRDHVLLPFAGDLDAADAMMTARITSEVLHDVLALVPDALLMDAPSGVEPPFQTAAANRDAYLGYFQTRLQAPRLFAEAAVQARDQRRAEPPVEQKYRR